MPLWLACLIAVFPFGMAVIGARGEGVARRIGAAYLAAFAAMLAIHFIFGWRSFEAMGDPTIAQTRYYNILWPGLAFAGTAGVLRLMRWRRAGGRLAVGAYLAPTALGGLIGWLIARSV